MRKSFENEWWWWGGTTPHTCTPLDTTHALPITIFRCYRLTPPPPPTPPLPNGSTRENERRWERQCRPTEKTLLIRIISPLEQSSHFEVGWSGGDPTRTLHMSLMRKKEEIPNQMLRRKKQNITREEEDVLDSGPHIPKRQECPLLLLLIQKLFFLGFLTGGGLK